MIARCPPASVRRVAQLPRTMPLLELPRGTILYRVHDLDAACDAFIASDSDAGSPRRGGRFDPLPQHAPVPVLYAASRPEAALAEVLVHIDARGVLHPDGTAELPCRALSRLRVARTLRVVAFCGLDLHRFPVRHAQLAECGKSDYPRTRGWALAIRRRARRAQGMAWVSRQDNTALSFVFWHDRMEPGDLEPQGRPVPLAGRRGAAMVRDVLGRIGMAPLPSRAVRASPRSRGRRS